MHCYLSTHAHQRGLGGMRLLSCLMGLFMTITPLAAQSAASSTNITIQVHNPGTPILSTSHTKVHTITITLQATDSNKQPLSNVDLSKYRVQATSSSLQVAKLVYAHSITDSNGTARLFVEGGTTSGPSTLNIMVLSPDGQYIGSRTTKVLGIHLPQFLWTLLGGLTFFILGLKNMSASLQAANANGLKRVLGLLTKNPVVGLLLGIIVTIIIQSSSATTVMLVGLINAGLMNLIQAIPIILGANIGTTITAQIVAFNVEELALPSIVIGTLLSLSKQETPKLWGKVLAGFGLLFYGLDMMGSTLKPLTISKTFFEPFIEYGRRPVLGVVVGMVATFIVQSSSVTTSIIVALAGSGLLDFTSSFYLVAGANIGTTITAHIAAIGSNPIAKQAAWVHTIFNTICVTIAVLIMNLFKDANGIPYYFSMIANISDGELVQGPHGGIWEKSGDVARLVANDHTLLNTIGVLLLFPFYKLLAKLAMRIIPSGSGKRYLQSLETHLLDTPSLALAQAYKEFVYMLTSSKDITSLAVAQTLDPEARNEQKILKIEDRIDKAEYEINRYLFALSAKNLSAEERAEIPYLMQAASYVESIGDIANRIRKIAKTLHGGDFILSSQRQQDLRHITALTYDMFDTVITGLTTNDSQKFVEVARLEQKIDMFYREVQRNNAADSNTAPITEDIHQSRILFMDCMSCLEQIADQLDEIAKESLGWSSSSNPGHTPMLQPQEQQ